jgi:hypothetical protein
MSEGMILRNQAVCSLCGDHIKSIHKHDFKSCCCGALSVDGGPEYLRRLGNPGDYRDTSITIPLRLVNTEAAQYLGVLVALGDTTVAGTSWLEGQLLAQFKKYPWFTPPKNKRTLLVWLRRLVSWDLVEELTTKGDSQCYWKSKVELAPWEVRARNTPAANTSRV